MNKTSLRPRTISHLNPRRLARIPRPLRPFVGLTATEGASRLLSFAFYILAARASAPSGFGEVRYTITLALLAFGPLQVLVTAIQREIGAVRGTPAEHEVIGTSLSVTLALWILTIVATAILGATGITGVARPAGLAMVISGYAVFMTYYSIARGRGEIRRAATSYAGGSLFNFGIWDIYSGGTSDAFANSGVVFSQQRTAGAGVRDHQPRRKAQGPGIYPRGRSPALEARSAAGSSDLRILAWQSADQIWVEQVFGRHEIGLYAAAKNLSQPIVLPMGVSGVLIPRMAKLRQDAQGAEADRLLRRAAGISFILSAAIGGIVLLNGPLILRVVLGSAYTPAASSLSALTIAMVLYAPFSALVSAAVGWVGQACTRLASA